MAYITQKLKKCADTVVLCREVLAGTKILFGETDPKSYKAHLNLGAALYKAAEGAFQDMLPQIKNNHGIYVKLLLSDAEKQGFAVLTQKQVRKMYAEAALQLVEGKLNRDDSIVVRCHQNEHRLQVQN